MKSWIFKDENYDFKVARRIGLKFTISNAVGFKLAIKVTHKH